MRLSITVFSASLLLLTTVSLFAEEVFQDDVDVEAIDLSEGAAQNISSYYYCWYYPDLPECYWYRDRDVGFVYQHLVTRGSWGRGHHHHHRRHDHVGHHHRRGHFKHDGHRRHDGHWQDRGKFRRQSGHFRARHSRGHSLRSKSFARGSKSFRTSSFRSRRR